MAGTIGPNFNQPQAYGVGGGNNGGGGGQAPAAGGDQSVQRPGDSSGISPEGRQGGGQQLEQQLVQGIQAATLTGDKSQLQQAYQQGEQSQFQE